MTSAYSAQSTCGAKQTTHVFTNVTIPLVHVIAPMEGSLRQVIQRPAVKLRSTMSLTIHVLKGLGRCKKERAAAGLVFRHKVWVM